MEWLHELCWFFFLSIITLVLGFCTWMESLTVLLFQHEGNSVESPSVSSSGTVASEPVVLNGVTVLDPAHIYLETNFVRETKGLVSELCRHFYTLGWVSGTGGSITIKVHDDSIPRTRQLIVMSPSGSLSLCTCIYPNMLSTVCPLVFMLRICFICRCSEGENDPRGHVCAFSWWVYVVNTSSQTLSP